MFKTLSLLNKYDIEVAINSVLTNKNGDKTSVKNLLDKLKGYKISKITLNPAERSAAWDVESYEKYKLNEQEIEILENYIQEIQDNYDFRIIFTGYLQKKEIYGDKEYKKENFNNRAYCTANVTQFAILSDGQVTICEELYWNPKFIIGNVNTQSLKEIWHSEKALQLAHLNRDMFSEKSVCKSCSLFEECRLNKGVCWSQVEKVYGRENWDFPSPLCPYAPPPIYPIEH